MPRVPAPRRLHRSAVRSARARAGSELREPRACLPAALAVPHADGALRLLIACGDPLVRRRLMDACARYHIAAVSVTDIAGLLDEARGEPHAVILDELLAGAVLSRLCALLTREHDATILFIGGATALADACFPAPCDTEAVIAAAEAFRRRLDRFAARPRSETGLTFAFAGYRYDHHHRRLVRPDGHAAHVPARTADVLLRFLSRPRVTLTRAEVQALVRPDGGGARVDVNVALHRLRRLLGQDASQPALIETVRNEGYRLNAAVSRR